MHSITDRWMHNSIMPIADFTACILKISRQSQTCLLLITVTATVSHKSCTTTLQHTLMKTTELYKLYIQTQTNRTQSTQICVRQINQSCSSFSGECWNEVIKCEHYKTCVRTKIAFFDCAISTNKLVNFVFAHCRGHIANLNTITRPGIAIRHRQPSTTTNKRIKHSHEAYKQHAYTRQLHCYMQWKWVSKLHYQITLITTHKYNISHSHIRLLQKNNGCSTCCIVNKKCYSKQWEICQIYH